MGLNFAGFRLIIKFFFFFFNKYVLKYLAYVNHDMIYLLFDCFDDIRGSLTLDV